MLVRLATEEEKDARARLSHAAWGARLTVEQFVARDRALRATRFAREGMRTWVALKDGEVVSSCETFRMRSAAGGVEGESHGVASVYTEPRLRGRGHATAMTKLVVEEVRRAPSAQALLLFSEVGATIYERAGFAPRPVREVRLAAQPGDPAEGVDRCVPEAEAGAAVERARRPRDPFVVWPTAAQVEWHLARERWYAEALGLPRLPCAGAVRGGAVALWSADGKPGRLVVQALVGDDPAETGAVLRSARRAAAAAGLSRVVLWAPEGAAMPPDADEGPSADLPMLCPLTPCASVALWRTIPHGIWV